MDDKKAANILLAMLEKYSLSKEEKEAIKNAVGILSWTLLSAGRVKKLKEKKEKNIKW
jgi:hypothetical protein